MIQKMREEGYHAVSDDGIYMEDMIMERVLGRPLADNETVFHRDGNTLNNCDNNLYVMKFGRLN
jgi:hypothetical protein